MSEQDSGTGAPVAVSTDGPSDLDTALRHLIDVDGRAIATAKRVEQVVKDPETSPALRQKLIDSMNRMIASSNNVHHFIKEKLAPSLTGKAPGSPTATLATKRRRPRRPRVRL